MILTFKHQSIVRMESKFLEIYKTNDMKEQVNETNYITAGFQAKTAARADS